MWLVEVRMCAGYDQLDINQGRVPAPSPNVPEPKSYYYNSTSTPRVHLDVEIDPEPLTDWVSRPAKFPQL